MKQQLEERRRWHLAQIQTLASTTIEHVDAIAEIERLLASPELPGLGGTLPPAPPAPGHLVPAASESTPGACRCRAPKESRP